MDRWIDGPRLHCFSGYRLCPTVVPLARRRDQGDQMAERLGNRAIKQMVAGSIPECAKLCCDLGQGTSPYLPLGMSPSLL